MRARPAAVAAAVLLLGACSGGDTGGFVPVTSTTMTTTPAPPGPKTVPTTTLSIGDPAGSVTLRVTGFTLPDMGAGGTGMRLLVRAGSTQVGVRRRGGGGAVSVCPVAGPTAAVNAGDCVDLAANGAVAVGSAGGVELRATGPEASLDEVGVTYCRHPEPRRSSRPPGLPAPARHGRARPRSPSFPGGRERS